MQMGTVAPDLANCTGGVKKHENRLDKPYLRVQNADKPPAQVGTCYGHAHGLASQGGAYAQCSFEP